MNVPLVKEKKKPELTKCAARTKFRELIQMYQTNLEESDRQDVATVKLHTDLFSAAEEMLVAERRRANAGSVGIPTLVGGRR
jgi:hypothetical protein